MKEVVVSKLYHKSSFPCFAKHFLVADHHDINTNNSLLTDIDIPPLRLAVYISNHFFRNDIKYRAGR